MASDPAKMQQIQLFLSSVLSQRGPSALPYAETTKWLIRQQLFNLISSYASLDLKTAAFTHNDGRSVILLQAYGTIPMPYQGFSYNIPVIIWLLESYPRFPPCVYVNPTRDMIIKRPHSNISPSGLVSLPYIQNWIYPKSNLLDLVYHLSAAFSRDPPLYNAQRRPQQQTDDAINMMAKMIHGDLISMRSVREAEAEGLLSLQAELKKREDELNMALQEMMEEKDTLEQQLQIISMNTDVLDTWIRENQGKSKNLDVDSSFECLDSLSKQMLECTALDLAMEDTVYSMDKSFREGSLPFDQYLKNVRLLSREQFFQRATAEKVRETHMEAQVASIAARLYS